MPKPNLPVLPGIPVAPPNPVRGPGAPINEAKLSAPVGLGGRNVAEDVFLVQHALALAGEDIRTDGVYTDGLVDAIQRYQINWTVNPTGIVRPGDKTWVCLSTCQYDVVPKFVQFQVGMGLWPTNAKFTYPYASGVDGAFPKPDRQWGTPKAVKTLHEVSFRCWLWGIPEIGIGDMSGPNPGRLPPHQEHHNGRMVDIRALHKDFERTAVSVGSNAYNRAKTRVLVNLLFGSGNVEKIIFNDPEIPRLRHDRAGTHIHDNHLHVYFKE